MNQVSKYLDTSSIIVYIYIYIYSINVGDCRRGWPELSFSLATAPRCKGGLSPFPWIASFYSWSVPNNAEC